MRTDTSLFGGWARGVRRRGQLEGLGPDASAAVHRGRRRASAVAWLCAVASVGLISVGSPALASAGTWSIVTSPNTSSSQDNELHGVTCATSSDCWAVGFAGTGIGGTEQTLAEHWDGTAWSIVATQNASSSQNNLIGVTCTMSSDCWAVGTAVTSGVDLTLAEHWDGTAWSVVATPNAGILFGVACTTSSDCWAVGGTPTAQTLAEHWDGTAWSVVTTPNKTSLPLDTLYGVACATSSDCWAVGAAVNNSSGSKEHTLAEHWNGTAWSIVATPNTSSPRNDLFGVSCATSSDCWAVGIASNLTGVNLTLAEHWDGTAWSVAATPSGNTYLLGVTCVTTSDCWAVGGGNEHWDGIAWSIVASPNAAPDAVACVASSDCWAVGFVTNGTVNQTLVEHFVAAAPTLTVTPTRGPSRTPITLNGTGFLSGEKVKVSYKTGLLAPHRAKRNICTATVASNGTFTCDGHVPNSNRAGATGTHKIVAKGTTSLTKAITTFTLT
jgi:hypothetical protein